ncbi:hypothetical protein H5410_028256 [Solanum commersonii]|uniref:Uncharacterized protein n=1 Tax=Solanum commersonii TaxID=4109 RepID=A0A9J5Z5M6_SOLCO|nr:hypothetical protein H5410_028256 [Solanum commersonii]
MDRRKVVGRDMPPCKRVKGIIINKDTAASREKLFPTTTLPSDFAPSYDVGSVATREADDSTAVQTAPIVPAQMKSQRTTQL